MRYGRLLVRCVHRLLRGPVLAALVPVLGPAVAHEVPADVQVTAYVRPAGQVLEVMIRVPMDAMQEVDFPLRGPYLEIARADEALRTATKVWLTDNLDVFEDGAPLPVPEVAAARVSLPSDRSFDSYATARENFAAPPLSDELNLVWNQQLLDVMLEYPIRSAASDFALDPRFERMGMRVNTRLIAMGPEGEARRFELHGNPGLVVLDPGVRDVAARFLRAGLGQVPGSAPHLLFLACLLLPFRQPRAVLALVGAFGAGAVVALAGAAVGFMPVQLWFGPLVDTLVAASIVVAAIDAVFAGTLTRRWMLGFVAGIAHGYAMAFGLGEQAQFAGAWPAVALAAFDVGVVLGIAVAGAVIALVLGLLFARAASDRLGVIVLSVLMGNLAWDWMADGAAALAMFPMPAMDAAFLAGLMRAALAALVLGGAMFVVAWATGGTERAPAGE